jgi:hypothetical protein
MLGIGNVYANKNKIQYTQIQVLRNCIVTVIADCNRREVRWEVDGVPYPFKASFEKARFPTSGASFRFAVGGANGGKTKIVNEKNEVIILLKEVENLREHPEIKKMKAFLDQALQQVESGGTDRDFHFHYGPDHFDEIAQICRRYIHACGFEDSEDSRFRKAPPSFEIDSVVQLSADFASHNDASGGPLEPGDIGIVTKVGGGRCLVVCLSSEGEAREWWYDAAALTTASPGDGLAPTTTEADDDDEDLRLALLMSMSMCTKAPPAPTDASPGDAASR